MEGKLVILGGWAGVGLLRSMGGRMLEYVVACMLINRSPVFTSNYMWRCQAAKEEPAQESEWCVCVCVWGGGARKPKITFNLGLVTIDCRVSRGVKIDAHIKYLTDRSKKTLK
jgi:hypothetical protein